MPRPRLPFPKQYLKYVRVPTVGIPTPILFAVVGMSDQVTRECVELPREVVAQLLAFARAEGLVHANVLSLHGLSKLESFTVQQLEKDLHRVLERSGDAPFKESVATVMPLVSRVAKNRQLSLWVDAGR